jgi:hypothetical protein
MYEFDSSNGLFENRRPKVAQYRGFSLLRANFFVIMGLAIVDAQDCKAYKPGNSPHQNI